MRKITKTLLAVLLVAVMISSSCAIGGVVSSAQSVAQGVSMAFTGANKGDWATIEGEYIQDVALYATVYNDTNEDIVLTDIEDTGNNIIYSGWTSGIHVAKGQPFPIKVEGTVDDNTVLSVTVTYHLNSKPVATSEKVTAYIYCSSQDYITNECVSKTTNANLFPVTATFTFGPVTTSETEDVVTAKDQPGILGEVNVSDPHNEIEIYVDGSKYKNWGDLKLAMSFTETQRKYGRLTSLHMTTDSDTGSFTFNGLTVDKDNKDVTSTYDGENGFFWQISENEVASLTFTGLIPTEDVSNINMEFTGNGTASQVYGLLNQDTAPLNPVWNITIHNNNKSALRDRLAEIEMEGLNENAYSSGWNDFATALKNAYTALGTIQVTAEEVATALTNLNTAYGNLVRYAVVITDHYYYQGNNDQNPVAMKDTEYEMQVQNKASHDFTILVNGEYSEPFNRTRVTEREYINVGADTNYTKKVDQYYWYVNLTELQAAIDEYESINPYDGDNLIFYEDTWRAYTKAYNKAVEDKNNLELFQDDIDDTTAKLVAARKGLQRIVPDTEWLNEGMAWAKQIISGNYVDDFGYETETFGYDWSPTTLFSSTYSTPLWRNLMVAYNEAAEITDSGEYTESEIIRVTDQLWKAINDLRTTDMTTKGLMLSGTKRNSDIDKYGYFKSFSDKLELPTGLRVVFNDIIDSPDATTDDYQLNEEDFTADSWEMLQDALYGDYEPGAYACAETMESYPVNDSVGELSVPAYSMINNIWFLSSQADYNACRDNLISKVENLEYVVDYDALSEKLEEAKAYDLNEYTASSGQALNTEIGKVDAMIDSLAEPQLYKNANAITQAKVDKALEDLQDAIDSLVVRAYLEPKDDDVTISDEGVVRGEEIGTSVRSVLSDFNIVNESDATKIKVYTNAQRIKEVGINDNAGTGYEIVVFAGGEECASYTLVVVGDVIGSGIVEYADFQAVYNYSFKRATLAGIYLEAADVNGDGRVDLCDAATLRIM